jgi:putative phosphotransacetylase
MSTAPNAPKPSAPKANAKDQTVPLGISNRHLHVSKADLEALFGPGYKLREMRPLKQPGQFACEEIVTVVGPKGQIEGVRILGPERKATQVEVSLTDAFKLGIKPPVRDSGDLEGSASLTVVGPKGQVNLRQGAILALRHIHMHTSEGQQYGYKDKDRVSVRAVNERGVVFENVLVRVNDAFALEMHLDTDEANAALLKNGDLLKIIGKQGT